MCKPALCAVFMFWRRLKTIEDVAGSTAAGCGLDDKGVLVLLLFVLAVVVVVAAGPALGKGKGTGVGALIAGGMAEEVVEDPGRSMPFGPLAGGVPL